MYISYSSSDSYAEYTGISMLSLFENNKDTKIDEVFLLDNGISSKNLKKICDIADRYERKLTIMDVSDTLEQYASETKLKKFNGSYSTYARLIPERIYPQYVDFLIVIDSDTIINKSIEHLPINNLQEKVIAAIDNPEAHMNPSFLGIDDKELLKKKGFYLNCGIMIFNIPKWRENKLPIRIKESILNIKEFRFVDQTIINYTMNRDEILFLELTFNSFFSCLS